MSHLTLDQNAIVIFKAGLKPVLHCKKISDTFTGKKLPPRMPIKNIF